MSEPQTPETPPQRNVRLARLSGKATAAWLIGSFLLIGLLIPTVVRLPLWIDFEIVLAVWWLVWLTVLARLLYTGQRIAADHQLGTPRNWLGSPGKSEPTSKKDEGFRWWHSLDFMPGDGEGCLVLIAMVVGAVLFLSLIWFLIEIAIPVALFLLYLMVRGMLAHVINDRHRCRGSIGRALAWAFVWATAYTAPLAGLVWFVQFVQSR